MIFDISDINFKKMMGDPKLALPIRWDGNDFEQTVHSLFHYYLDEVKRCNRGSGPSSIKVDQLKLIRITTKIEETIQKYLNGSPVEAYAEFKSLMNLLVVSPIWPTWIYEKSGNVLVGPFDKEDPLHLFRATRVYDSQKYSRSRTFHTPYNLRSKIGTCRYSIAGFPSLYLATSLALCWKEIKAKRKHQILAASFRLDRSVVRSNVSIQVIELGIKPQDFTISEHEDRRKTARNALLSVGRLLLSSHDIRSAYLLWYPLIAACSYIRAAKKDPFAPEYIIPQLLMQWVRSETEAQQRHLISSPANMPDPLIGIRYFSCASKRASEEGFNYVFPTSGSRYLGSQYCDVLTRAFKVTEPVYINNYPSIPSYVALFLQCFLQIHLYKIMDK